MATKTPAKRLRNGVIYGRQSRTQAKSASIATQAAACRKAAKTFGVKVVAEIIEPPSTSAYKKRGRERPRFPELLQMVEAGAAEVVIVYMTDRLSRGGGPGWAPLWDAAEKSDIDIDLDRFVLTPDGFKSEFELGIRATMDREESRKTSERLKDMKERHASEGRVAGGGPRPYGYAEDRITIVDEEAKIIREIVARYLAGEGTRALARWLNKEGHKSASGKEWSASVVLNMLRSPRMAGMRVHRGEIVADAVWPAIIDRPTWDRLAARVAETARGPGQSKTSKYLLQQVMRCSICGERMTGAPAPVRGGTRYRCQKSPGRGNCGKVSIAAEPVDELVVSMLLYRLDSPAVADALAGRTRLPVEEDQQLSSQIIGLEGRLDEARSMYSAGEIDRKDLVSIRRTIEEELQRLRSRIVRNEQVITIAAFLEEGVSLASMWEDLPQGRRQQILRAVIDQVRVSPATIRGSKVVDLSRVEVIWRV